MTRFEFFTNFFLQADVRSQVLFDTESHGSGMYLPELDDPEHANASNTALYELHILRVSDILLREIGRVGQLR